MVNVKILVKRERGRIQGLSQFLVTTSYLRNRRTGKATNFMDKIVVKIYKVVHLHKTCSVGRVNMYYCKLPNLLLVSACHEITKIRLRESRLEL